MATELGMPSPAKFSSHMPSPRIQHASIFPLPGPSTTFTQGAPLKPDYQQEHTMSREHRSNYTQALPHSVQPIPPLRTDLPPTLSPVRSVSSHSPSLASSASPPRNFELPVTRKRPYDQGVPSYDRASRDVPHTIFSQTPESSGEDPRTLPPICTASSRSPVSYTSSPASAEGYSQQHNQVLLTSNVPQQRSPNRAQHCRIHIRQQPRAARAGPDGKDRRTIDPPPILQLLIPDFDPNSVADIEDLKSAHWVVHCRLVSPSSPRQEMGMLCQTSEDGQSSVQRLLLGNYVSGPMFCEDDPDPDTAPEPLQPAPSSPSTRLMMRPQATSQRQKSLPATFFIFADLSVRKAGEYRLEFKLMKMEPQLLFPGKSVPTIHSVTSDVFKVVNAKDFDQVQPSTKLVRGLLDRGAGFPLKLKKGPREGQARRYRSERGFQADDEHDDNVEEE